MLTLYIYDQRTGALQNTFKGETPRDCEALAQEEKINWDIYGLTYWPPANGYKYTNRERTKHNIFTSGKG